MSTPASERTLAARENAYLSWAATENRSARTAPAREARDRKFLEMAGGDPVRAEAYRKAHFIRLSRLSAQSRRRARELGEVADRAEAELASLDDGGDAA